MSSMTSTPDSPGTAHHTWCTREHTGETGNCAGAATDVPTTDDLDLAVRLIGPHDEPGDIVLGGRGFDIGLAPDDARRLAWALLEQADRSDGVEPVTMADIRGELTALRATVDHVTAVLDERDGSTR